MDRTICDFSIGSLNVRGLNNRIKRLAIYNWIKQKNVDIFMLQESYCTSEVCSTWEAEWGGKCLFAYGSKHSRGTMILFKAGLNVNILSVKVDKNGRYIIAKLEIEDLTFVLVNIYAPNKINEKELFFPKYQQRVTMLEIQLTDN